MLLALSYERMNFCAVHEDAVEVEMIWNASGEQAALVAVENGKG